jgi:hypothetical protein
MGRSHATIEYMRPTYSQLQPACQLAFEALLLGLFVFVGWVLGVY